jgi:hypothetical protein
MTLPMANFILEAIFFPSRETPHDDAKGL